MQKFLISYLDTLKMSISYTFFQILEASLTRFLFKQSLFALSMSLFQFEKQYVHEETAVFIYTSFYSYLWLFCMYLLLCWSLSVKNGVGDKLALNISKSACLPCVTAGSVDKERVDVVYWDWSNAFGMASCSTCAPRLFR